MLELNQEEVAKAFAEAQKTSIEKPVETKRLAWPYEPAAEAIAVKTASEHDLGAGNVLHSAVFPNGVVVNSITRTDKPKEVKLTLRLERKPGEGSSALTGVASASFMARGTGALPITDINQHIGPPPCACARGYLRTGLSSPAPPCRKKSISGLPSPRA